ncbi:MAG: hypothetical protein JW902_17670 [Syntrophaceae bacterium]|nr:hypothetical protein [Syntrophaceae bacterium]
MKKENNRILLMAFVVMSFLLSTVSVFALAPSGNQITSDLWIAAVIETVEKGPVEAVWQKGGEDTTTAGDRVIWGYFYASPTDVTWGSENNPDLYVKIWFDHGGRLDVNFFHVSVPDIEVYSDFPYDGTPDEHETATMTDRYVWQYYYCEEKSYNQIMTEKLWGTWYFSYTIGSAHFDQTYYLNKSIAENSSSPGVYDIMGTDEYGGLIIAGYTPDLGKYSLLDTDTLFNRFYVFDLTTSNTVSGCYYQVKDGDLGSCYNMSGSKIFASGKNESDKLGRFQAPELEEAYEAEGDTIPDQNVIDVYNKMKELLNRESNN